MDEVGNKTIEQIQKIDKAAQKIGEEYDTEGLGDALTKALSGETDFSFLNNLSVKTGKKIKEGIEKGGSILLY